MNMNHGLQLPGWVQRAGKAVGAAVSTVGAAAGGLVKGAYNFGKGVVDFLNFGQGSMAGS
jgi:hypothetical protein